jgi:transcriptional regulator with XRE-family HTH domain
MNKQPSIKSIAATAKDLCERTGLSQADIARQLGVPPKTLNDWLRDPPRTTCRHRQMLALALEALKARLVR